jgi:uncharacterized SAM-binding protein YcdF (DUF218 family)
MTDTDADAIVVLGGYLVPPDEVRPEAEVGVGTFYRCLRAAEVYHRVKRLPVVVSGGKADPSPHCPTLSAVMREFLTGHGVRDGDVIVEDRSRSTYENAVESARLLKARGLRKVILVTDAAHMERSVRCFRKQGVAVVPVGCHYRATALGYSVSDFLPASGTSSVCLEALHEWLGMAWYKWHGRI